MKEFIDIFMDVVKNHYIDFKGRTRRKVYWHYVAVVMLISIVLNVLTVVLGSIAGILATILGLVSMVVSLALFLPGLGVTFRRIQDTGKPGWFLIIPIYNIILLVSEGTKGDNEYGADPKAGE